MSGHPETEKVKAITPAEAQARILVADDDPTMRELATVRLSAHGYHLTDAANGATAWEILGAETFDLAIIDLRMPRLNGFELIELIRGSVAHRYMPIIVITTLNDTGSIERAFGTGATAFVTKPVNWALLIYQVRYVLRASEVERELRRAKEEAEAVNTHKDGFLSIMSHELRTPLNAIIGFAELLDSQSEGPIGNTSYRNYINEILGGGQRLLGTLNGMFVFSQILSDDLELREGEYYLSSLKAEIAGAARSLAQSHDVHLNFEGLEDDVKIICDLKLLAQSLNGLIENAIKFSPPQGEVTVTGTISMDGRFALSVRDRGPGMNADDIATFLAPFTQSDMSLRRSAEGLGLGLAIANTLVRLHGGELMFERGPGGGTVARIILPRSRIVVAPTSTSRHLAGRIA